MFRNRPISLALAGLFAWATGCSTYTQVAPGDVTDYEKVRVTTRDGLRVDYYDPFVEADSIKGRGIPGSEAVYAMSLDRVTTIEEGGSEPGKTTALVIGIMAGAAILAFLGYWAGES